MKTLLVLLLPMLLWAQPKTTYDTLRDTDDNGNDVVLIRPFVNGEVHGIARVLYSTGELKLEVSYKHGKIHGTEIWYDKNGTIRKVFNFVNGCYHGAVETFDERGLHERINYYFYGMQCEKERFWQLEMQN